MTTAVSTARTNGGARARSSATSFARVLRSEWIKLWSVRSNTVMLLGAGLAAIVLGVLIASVGTAAGPGGSTATDSLSLSLAGVDLAMIVLGALGVTFVASEYSTKLVHVTFAAVPSRWPVLVAKTLVLGAVASAVMAVSTVAAVLAGQAVYDGATASLSDPDVWRVVFGEAAYAVGVGLMGLMLAFILRSTAAALGVLLAFILIVPNLLSLVSDSYSDWITPYLPTNAAAAFTSVDPSSDLLSPAGGAIVFGAWIVGLLITAAASLRWRDV